MERHKEVLVVIQALRPDEGLVRRETSRAVTPFGAAAVFIADPRKIAPAGKIREHMPVRWRSPNPIDSLAPTPSAICSIRNLLRPQSVTAASCSGNSAWAM